MRLVYLVLILMTSSAGLALDHHWAHATQLKILKLIENSKIPKSDLGIYISSDGTDPVEVVNVNAKKKMIPASITKIITAATVLNHLPPGTKFKTQLLSSGKIEGANLKGDLYLKGGGDPSFVSENMWYLVNVFLRTQVKVIEGDIIVDDSLFDNLRFDPSRENIRVDRAYDAPTGAMSFNWNSVNIFVRPALKKGDKAFVFADPENEYIQLKADVKTVSADSGTEIQVDRRDNEKNEDDTIYVKGKIALNSKEVTVYKNITRPDLWSGYNLKNFLRQRGIELKGKVKAGIVSADARVLAESESKPIEHILADMNKFSNNYIAEMLTKAMATQEQTPGAIPQGIEMEKKYLSGLGVARESYSLVNPSGLTMENRLRALDLWKVLNDMKNQFQYQPEFLSSLPIAGIDGTLKKRMKGTSGERWIRAKTGFLTGVVSLAGYVGRMDGTVLPFVMMFNGSHDAAAVRGLYDRICLALVE